MDCAHCGQAAASLATCSVPKPYSPLMFFCVSFWRSYQWPAERVGWRVAGGAGGRKVEFFHPPAHSVVCSGGIFRRLVEPLETLTVSKMLSDQRDGHRSLVGIQTGRVEIIQDVQQLAAGCTRIRGR